MFQFIVSSKRRQDAIDKSSENIETIETCKRKIKENIQSEKDEIQKKIRIKKRNVLLAEEVTLRMFF